MEEKKPKKRMELGCEMRKKAGEKGTRGERREATGEREKTFPESKEQTGAEQQRWSGGGKLQVKRQAPGRSCCTSPQSVDDSIPG